MAELDPNELVRRSVWAIRELVPDFEIAPKTRLWPSREYWTTIYKVARFPVDRVVDRNNGITVFADDDWKVVWHEGEHAWSHRGLRFLLRWPAYVTPWRAVIEARAYAVQMVIDYKLGLWDRLDGVWRRPLIIEDILAQYEVVEDALVGKPYLFALPWRRPVRWLLRRHIERIIRGDLTPYEQAAARFVGTQLG